MDYGLELQFGFFLPPDADPPAPGADPVAAETPRAVRLARLCDELGLDLIGIQDHPYQRKYFDTWTLLSYLAAATRRARLFTDVASLPLRPPAVLAKAAATLDVLSGGRFELGLGAGAYWEGIAAMGGPTRTPGEAVEALEEAVQVIRLMWSGGRGLRFEGQHYRLQGAHGGPVPAHPVGIWLGAYGPRMLALTGRLADGWVPSSSYAPPEKLPAMQARIDRAARKAGRDPAAIRRVYNIMGMIGGNAGKFLTGPVEHWAEALANLALEVGIDTFIFSPAADHEAQVALFAREVVPRAREAVRARRAK